MSLIWMSENWRRAKKLPDLDKVLKDLHKEEEPQKPENMLDVIKALNAKFGGTVY